jgi:hypothetical protein
MFLLKRHKSTLPTNLLAPFGVSYYRNSREKSAIGYARFPPGEAIRAPSRSSIALGPEPTAQTDPNRTLPSAQPRIWIHDYGATVPMILGAPGVN